MKIALFGGSFNPIHNGHLQIANELVNKKIVDEVWFIPCGNHPFDKKLVDGVDRINMIKLCIEGNPKLKVLDMEILSDKISFTSETIKTLKERFKEIDFYFIIGADNLANLHKWNNFGYLKKNVEFILIKRPSFELFNNQRVNIKKILDIDNKISSNQIRKNLRKGIPIKGLVPEKVEKYIKGRNSCSGRPNYLCPVNNTFIL